MVKANDYTDMIVKLFQMLDYRRVYGFGVDWKSKMIECVENRGFDSCFKLAMHDDLKKGRFYSVYKPGRYSEFSVVMHKEDEDVHYDVDVMKISFYDIKGFNRVVARDFERKEGISFRDQAYKTWEEWVINISPLKRGIRTRSFESVHYYVVALFEYDDIYMLVAFDFTDMTHARER